MSGRPYRQGDRNRWHGQQQRDQYSDTSSQPSASYLDDWGSDSIRSSGIRQRINTLYREQLYADVKFFVNSGRKQNSTISAHKAVLAVGSKKFAEMLFAAPSSTAQTAGPMLEVEINNVSFEAFRNMIEYLYTDELFYESDVLMMETLNIARLYEIQPLVNQCESYFESLEVTENNACTMLHLATTHKMEDRKNRCIQFIQENTADVIRSLDFEQSPLAAVRTICKFQKLNLQSEVQLFEAVMKWTEANAHDTGDKRLLLEPLLKSIRFLAMKPAEFSRLMQAHCAILTTNEILNIVTYLTSPPHSRNFSSLPTWCNKGENRCFPREPVQAPGRCGSEVDGNRNVIVALRNFHRQPYLTSLTSILEIKCIGGKHVMKAVKLSFQGPVTEESTIGLLILTVQVLPRRFRIVEKLKIHNSVDVRVPLSKYVLFRDGDMVKITAEASNIMGYEFLQFDGNNSFSNTDYFNCTIGSIPQENRLFFISEVDFEPQPSPKFKSLSGQMRIMNLT